MRWRQFSVLVAATLSSVGFPGCTPSWVYDPPNLPREDIAIVRTPGSAGIVMVDDERVESVLVPQKSSIGGAPRVRPADEVQVLPGSHSYQFGHWNICKNCPYFAGIIRFPVEADHEYEIRVESGLDRSPQISVQVVDIKSDEKVPFEWLDRSHSDDLTPTKPRSRGVGFFPSFPSGSISF